MIRSLIRSPPQKRACEVRTMKKRRKYPLLSENWGSENETGEMVEAGDSIPRHPPPTVDREVCSTGGEPPPPSPENGLRDTVKTGDMGEAGDNIPWPPPPMMEQEVYSAGEEPPPPPPPLMDGLKNTVKTGETGEVEKRRTGEDIPRSPPPLDLIRMELRLVIVHHGPNH